MFQKYINYVHPTFCLNGEKLDVLALKQKANIFIESTDEALSKLGMLILEWFNDNDYTEITTSGTTGIPKKIRITKQTMVASALATAKHFNIPENARALHCLPVQYIAGKMMFIRAIILGWDLTYITPSSNPLEDISDSFDFVAMVPLQVENSLCKIHQIKTVIIGGAKLNSSLKEQLLQVSTQVYETYGMTETVTHIAAKLISEPNFKALPQVFFSVDSRNCLSISAPHISQELVVTNDIVDLISDIEFVWLGRLDNVINSGGIKIFPEKVEEKIESYIDTRFFITSLPDEKLGHKVIIVIEGEDRPIDFTQIKHLSKYEVPKQIFFVEKFLETETSKIKRAEILKQLSL